LSCNSEGCQAVNAFIENELGRRGARIEPSVFEGADNFSVYIRLRMTKGTRTLELQQAQVASLDGNREQLIQRWLDENL